MLDPATPVSHQPHRLLTAARPLEQGQPHKRILPLTSSSQILPGAVAVVQNKPQIEGLLAKRLLVADPQKWRVSTLRAGPRIGGFRIGGDHPALLDPGPASSALLPRLSVDGGVELEIKYVGPEPTGEFFRACLCVEEVPAAGGTNGKIPHDQERAREAPHVSFLATSPAVASGVQVKLPLPARTHDLYISGLTLRVDEPSHWVVNDILIDNDTLLVNHGDLPGEILTERPGRPPLRLGRLRAREDLVVIATYIGPLLIASLTYEVSGSEVPTSDRAADSAFFSMSTPVPIATHALIHSRADLPRGYAFVPEEVILHEPEKWDVGDIHVGVESMFAGSGYAPGVIFGANTHGDRPNLNKALDYGVELRFDLSYSGSNPTGKLLLCGIIGRVIRWDPTS